MTRRPKLSLSPDDKVEKRQAPGFKTAAPSGNSEIKPGTKESPSENIGTQHASNEGDKEIPQVTTPPGGKRLVTVVLFVVVAALSLYLLKRRLL